MGSAHETDEWREYADWNSGLVDYFFGPTALGRPVYLDVEDEALEVVARTVGAAGTDPEAALCASVAGTLNWGRGGVFKHHTDAMDEWTADGAEGAPPFVGLLSTFAAAAERMEGDDDHAPHNYYGRLCEVLAIDADDEAATEKLQRDYRKQAPGLWAALNRWLLAAGGSRGLPTAAAFDRRVFVGVPISQALVRARDRESFRDMFSSYRLRAHQRVARDDMVELLAAWAPSAPPSLRRLLTAGDTLLEHVADAATVELAAWDGLVEGYGETGDGAGPPRSGSLVLTATYLSGAWPRLDLDLAVSGTVTGSWEAPPDATGPAADAAREASPLVAVQEVDGWTTFESAGELSVPDAIKGVLILADGDRRLERPVRRVVVFTADEHVPWLVERPRAELWEDTWLLVHDSVIPKLEALLDQIARPGYPRRNPGDLPGVPEGWSFFGPLQLAVSPGDLPGGSEDLLPLVPISESHVVVDGSLPLGGNGVFHASSDLEVRATASGGRAAKVSLIPEFVYGDDRDERILGDIVGTGVFPLASQELEDGDYRVVVLDAKREVLATSTFRLRSAEHPLSPSSWLSEVVAHVPGGEASLYARRHSEEPVPPYLRGPAAYLDGVVEETQPTSDVEVPATLGAAVGTRDDDIGPIGPTVASTHVDMPCPPHVIELPPTDNAGRIASTFKGHCRNCGLERWYRRSGRGRRRAAANSVGAGKGNFVLPDLPQADRAAPADADALLDAISTVGMGGWATFERVVRLFDEAPWGPREYARSLTALGHIEFLGDSAGLRPASWVVTPPALVGDAVSPTRAFLAGSRGMSLLARLDDAASALGAHVSKYVQSDAPTLVEVETTDPEDLSVIADDVGLVYRPGPAERILRFAPGLSELVAAKPLTAAPGQCDVSRYDPVSGRWEAVSGVTGDGAYRFDLRPVRHVVVRNSRPFEVENSVAKFAGAALAGVASLAHSSDDSTLYVPLGARLPGLFERAAVLCSGRAPVETGDGRLAYGGVTGGVASGLSALLGPDSMQAQK